MASDPISVICKAPGDKSHLAVSGNYVVWMDNRSGISGVYIYSLAQEMEIPLAATQFSNMYPEINGEVIAWMALDPIKNYWAIRTFDIATDNRTELVWSLSAPSTPSISDTYLAYSDMSIAAFGWGSTRSCSLAPSRPRQYPQAA